MGISPFEVPVTPFDEVLEEDMIEIEAAANGALEDVPTIIGGVSVEERLALPKFEGKEVKSTILKVALKVDELPSVTLDDRVCICAHIRVQSVNHTVDKEGDVVRVISAKQDDAFVQPFVDGQDDGVIRS